MSSFWNALTGRKSSSIPHSPISNDDLSQSPTGGAGLPSLSPTSSSSSSQFDPSSIGGVSSFLTPFTIDPSELHPLAGLEEGLSYINLDETALDSLPGSRSALPSRGWSDDLCYGTGTTYLAGLAIGGTWGLVEGLRKCTPNTPPKLKLNTVLNAVTRRGPFLGNSAGVIALMYNGINSTIGYYRGKHEAANSILAGVLAGTIWKSTKGLRPMLIAGGLTGTAAGLWAVGRKTLA